MTPMGLPKIMTPMGLPKTMTPMGHPTTTTAIMSLPTTTAIKIIIPMGLLTTTIIPVIPVILTDHQTTIPDRVVYWKVSNWQRVRLVTIL
jgi:hypothetical protein